MTQTLRRELRQKLGEVCNKYLHDYSVPFVVAEKFIDDLADAALELRAFSFQPKTIQDAIWADLPVTEEILNSEKAKTEAPKMFEKALGFGSLPWDSSKEWRALQKFITEIYIHDRNAFGKFLIWRAGDGKYNSMSNKQIRMNPQIFMDTGWAEFENSQKKTDETRPVQEEGKSSGYYA